MKTAKKIFVFLLVCQVMFYPLLASLSNASAQRGRQAAQIPSQSDAREGLKSGAIHEAAGIRAQEQYSKLPLCFIENRGQMGDSVKFYEKGDGRTTFFTPDGVFLSFIKTRKPVGQGPRPSGNEDLTADSRAFKVPDPVHELVKLIPLNANRNPQITAESLTEGRVNYLIGKDPKKWKTDIPTYKAVIYKEVYQGVDIKFYGNSRQLEYDIIVKPGADIEKVKLAYEGAEGIKLTGDGSLEIALKGGKIIQKKPHIYQEMDGKRVEVGGRFILHGVQLAVHGLDSAAAVDGHSRRFTFGFQVASYDKRRPLIIDPVLAYSTYLGGSGYDGSGTWNSGIAVDSSGSAYVTGYTASVDFPTANAFQVSRNGQGDVFVTKLNPDGSGFVYSTYLGGSSYEGGYDIDVDSSGNVYVTGYTYSTDFPVVNAFQAINRGGPSYGPCDAFVAKINPEGSGLVYSTFLGGTGREFGLGIAVDPAGNASVTGLTESYNFPTANAFQANFRGGHDAFITKLNPEGSGLVYSTYLGGSAWDYGFSIAVDASGYVYVIGQANSVDFPTVHPIQSAHQGGWGEAFVAKVKPDGQPVYSTYLGGSGWDNGNSIAADADGNAYVTGPTRSLNFPTVNAFQPALNGPSDVFVAKLNSDGSRIIYSTYFGGSGHEGGEWGEHWGDPSIALDASGNVYMTGKTSSADFPTLNAVQPSLQGDYDAFITKLKPDGTGLVYSTCLGGSGRDWGGGIAVSEAGDAYVIGNTASADFPVVNAQTAYQGGYDVFMAKIAENRPPAADAGPDQSVEMTSCAGASVTLDGSGSSDPDGDPLTYTWTENGNVIATGVAPAVTLSYGSHTITLTVDDGKGGTSTDTVVINVVDTTAPALNVTLSPSMLWPPNHKYVKVTPSITVSDACAATTTVTLVSAMSSEPDDGLGDGDTSNDIVINADGTILLRAERSGMGSGRVYTMTYQAADIAGNTATASATVTVPHNQGR